MPLDLKTLEFLNSLRRVPVSTGDWKAAFDTLLVSLREQFIYDHMALYLVDASGGTLDVAHARAVGRGTAAEADVSWGEEMVGKVVATQQAIIQEPGLGPQADRLGAPYLIGLPVCVAGGLVGALVFVRFGGPAYSSVDRLIADWIAAEAASMLEARTLQQVRGELESVQRKMRLQDDFLSTISHELRTPLGFIKGYGTSLLRQDTVWDDKTRHEFLSIIDEETDRLTNLIENMLESARLQNNTVEYKIVPLRLDAVLREVTSRMRAQHPEVQVELDLDSVPLIMGDGEQLSRVFDNFFSNAVKYAPGSSLTIRLRHTGQTVCVSFVDRGPGIPDEFLPFIFDRFYRVPAATSLPGTGLGLYISQQIVLAHHGRVWAESVHGQGSTFVVELPMKPAD